MRRLMFGKIATLYSTAICWDTTTGADGEFSTPPERSGPWTTVLHTDYWGLGGTHGYRLPPEWIGPDPKNVTLVFSGVKLPTTTYDSILCASNDT